MSLDHDDRGHCQCCDWYSDQSYLDDEVCEPEPSHTVTRSATPQWPSEPFWFHTHTRDRHGNIDRFSTPMFRRRPDELDGGCHATPGGVMVHVRLTCRCPKP